MGDSNCLDPPALIPALPKLNSAPAWLAVNVATTGFHGRLTSTRATGRVILAVQPRLNESDERSAC